MADDFTISMGDPWRRRARELARELLTARSEGHGEIVRPEQLEPFRRALFDALDEIHEAADPDPDTYRRVGHVLAAFAELAANAAGLAAIADMAAAEAGVPPFSRAEVAVDSPEFDRALSEVLQAISTAQVEREEGLEEP